MPEFLIVLFHVITIFSAFSTLSLLALLHCYIRQNRFDPPPPPKRNQSYESTKLSLEPEFLSLFSLFIFCFTISLPSHLKYFLGDLEEIR